MFRAEISSHIIQKAKDVFVVSDSSKFGRVELTKICDPAEINHVATNVDLRIEYQKALQESGVNLILA